MPERLTPISKARAKLPRLSQAAQKRLDRYVITHLGQPQSVLVGYDEYQSMKAAVELMQRPDVVADIKAGLKELDEGKGVPLSEKKARVRDAIQLRETNKLVEELATESEVDSHIVENVMDRLGKKMMTVSQADGSMFMPGVGEIEIVCKDQQSDLREFGASPATTPSKPRDRFIEPKTGIHRATKLKPALAKHKVPAPKAAKEA